MMKEGGVSHPGNEYNPYTNGNMQHMYNNSRQTPDSGLGNEELRNSMNNAGGAGDNNGPQGGGGAPPPGFTPNPYYVGNAPQSQYNDQQQQQYRYKQYSGGQQEGGRFDRSTGPPSIVTMQTSPPNMDQDGTPSYNPNYGNYQQQYGNQGGPSYGGGMDRNFNAPQPMAARSHSNFSESSSGTLNMTSGGPPDASVLSGQPLMATGPHGGMMYPQQGGPMGHPYPLPHLQQGGGPNPFMQFNPAAHAAAMANQQHVQMMQGGPMGQQGGPAMQLPQGIPMQQPQGSGVGGGPPQSASPPHPGMMMMQPGAHGAPIHPGTIYYQHHPTMMGPRGPMAGQGSDGFVQLVYPHTAAAAQHQGGFIPMRGPPMMQQQRSLNSPAPSDNTDGQSVHGGPGSIGVWTGPPDQQGSSPPGGMQPMQQPPQQMQPMQQGMMGMQHPSMMTASFPGVGGAPFGVSSPGARMVPTPLGPGHYTPQQQVQHMGLQHAAYMQHLQQQQQGMQPMQQMQPFNAGGFPPPQQQQQQQPQTGYWQGPSQGGRGGYRGRGNRGGGGYGGMGGRPSSRQQYSRNNSMTSGGGRGRHGGGETEENSKCTTPTEDDIIDVTGLSQHLDSSLRMGDQSMEGGHQSMPHKQLLELADGKSVSPPAEPHPSDEDCVIVNPERGGEQEEGEEEGEGGAVGPSVPTTPRSEPRKELLEMKKTPKHQTDKSGSQSIPVDPVPPHGTSGTAGSGRKWSEVAAKMSCAYCRGRKQPVEEYTTHNVRDLSGKVTCPLFRATGCGYCGEKGDRAHDQFFCKERLSNEMMATQEHPAAGHATHPAHATHHGEREGAYRGGPKRGGAGGGGHYNKGRGGGGGGHGGKYESRRVQ